MSMPTPFTKADEMPDLLALLDQAIDELVPADSSRCSRSTTHARFGAGTANAMKTLMVPAVPVVPVRKQETAGTMAQIAGTTLTPDHATQKIARSSFLPIQREQREQRELDRIPYEYQGLGSSRCGSDCEPANGNNGNGSRQFILGQDCGLAASAREELFHERAAIAEFEGGMPRTWAEGFACLQTMACPATIRADRWEQLLVDAGRFLDQWPAQAAALGWNTLDVFGAHPTHPIERLDCAGLILLLHGDELLAFTADTARTRRRSGAILTYYRRPRPEAIPIWELR